MNQERIFKILLGPHISEKATIVAEGAQQVVFRVTQDATRVEIKKAVVLGVSTFRSSTTTRRS